MNRYILLLLLISSLSMVTGCVEIPVHRYTDGTLTPKRTMDELIRTRQVVPGESTVDSVARSLLASRPTDETPHLWQDRDGRRLIVRYKQFYKAYGFTLNQHFAYLPVPVWGIVWSDEKGLVLQYDSARVLQKWYVASQRDYVEYDLVPVRPTDNSGLTITPQP